MERGNQLEPRARMAYEFETGNDVVQVGGIYLNTDKELMISPDGLIPELKRVRNQMPKNENPYQVFA